MLEILNTVWLPINFNLHNIMMVAGVDNNTSLSPSKNSSICDFRLFQLGELSREGENATVVNNICPDSIFTPIFSGLFLFIYLVLVVFGLVGVVWKRNSGHVKARNPIYMILTIFASLFFVVVTCLRFIVGM